MDSSQLHDNFTRWLTGSREGLLSLAESAVGSRDEAEDVVQETMVPVWQAYREGRIHDLQEYASRAVWLNALKRKGRSRRHIPLESDYLISSGIPEPSVLPDEDRILTAWELEDAIRELPSPQQAVVRLRFYTGMSFREIGHSLQISLNTAASRCRYALETLRSALQKE
jgi:RNA polymerase sigma-70 factor (ECF subfamily)